MLQHLVNHGTYHRGQVATMLRQLGATPTFLGSNFFIATCREGLRLMQSAAPIGICSNEKF